MTKTLPQPFGPKYSARTAEGTYGDECAICGRRTKPDAAHARVVDGGTRFATPDEVADEAGDMGFFPIGSECAKSLPTAYLTRDVAH